MKNKILFLALPLALCFFNFGCETTPGGSDEGESLVSKAANFIDDHRDWLKKGLVAIGENLLSQQKDENDRKMIADQMWAVSTAFYSLSTGEAVTQDKFKSVISTFSGSNKIQGYSKYLEDISMVWSVVYPNLKVLNDPSKWKDYLILCAEAAQEVAQNYKTL